MHSAGIKDHAIQLRKDGYSLKEIAESLHIAKSTASVWLSELKISEETQRRFAEKRILGHYKTQQIRHQQKIAKKKTQHQKALQELADVPYSKELAKIYCALLWWCEGNKRDSFVRFTNSDPTLVTNYLAEFRTGFNLDETKFRVLMHLHSYHDEELQKKFWSKITKIPTKQFHKTFQKSNTGKRQKDGYQGCIAITYYDVRIANELEAIYNAFTTLRGVR